MKPCLACGTPTKDSYCENDRKKNAARDRPRKYERERPYNRASWRRLSKKARTVAPFCHYVDPDTGIMCGATEDLVTDHKPQAWQRYYAHKPLRLCDVQPLCRVHNGTLGPARGERMRRDD